MPVAWSPVRGPGGRLNFWAVSGTGNYRDDCSFGASIACDVLAEIRRTSNYSLLGWVVKDMKLGAFSGVEVGFLAAIAKCASSFSDHDADELCIHGGVVDPEDAVAVGSVGGDEAGSDENPKQRALIA